MKKQILKGSIVFAAESQNDIVSCLSQALDKIKEGYLSGWDSIKTGDYAFSYNTAEPGTGDQYHEAFHVGYKVVPCQHSFSLGKFSGLKPYQQGTIPDCYTVFAITWNAMYKSNEELVSIPELQIATCPTIGQADKLAELYRDQLQRKIKHNGTLTRKNAHGKFPD